MYFSYSGAAKRGNYGDPNGLQEAQYRASKSAFKPSRVVELRLSYRYIGAWVKFYCAIMIFKGSAKDPLWPNRGYHERIISLLNSMLNLSVNNV